MRERGGALEDHSGGVAELAVELGHRIGMTPAELRQLERAAQLHDLGKLAIDDTVLMKPRPLNGQEWRQVREHTLVGERMLQDVPGLSLVARLVRSSHERYDGTGYPDGLRGAKIPLGSRVLAICDAYEAMTSGRPYRAPLPPLAALDELRRCAGSQFDPWLVEAFCALTDARIDLHRPFVQAV